MLIKILGQHVKGILNNGAELMEKRRQEKILYLSNEERINKEIEKISKEFKIINSKKIELIGKINEEKYLIEKFEEEFKSNTEKINENSLKLKIKNKEIKMKNNEFDNQIKELKEEILRNKNEIKVNREVQNCFKQKLEQAIEKKTKEKISLVKKVEILRKTFNEKAKDSKNDNENIKAHSNFVDLYNE